MSRRPPNPGADRAAANQATLKTLVKLESNKSCADCKRNKHPRWASWNLGIFICIRCSGIHRGMGTHISRVKSVDLDAWTDEQLASMVKWGNSRANVYWEAKLAPGHQPSEAKIENFIRTKYDSKRWVMDGPMPDPSTLSDDSETVSATAAQEQTRIQRTGSLRTTGGPPASTARRQPVSDIDLFGDVPEAPVQRSSSAQPQATARAAAPPAPRKQGGDSLLGFDFFNGTSSNPPSRPTSAAPSALATAAPSRPDLKQSILSLYASVPKAAPPAQEQSAASPPAPKSAFSSLNDDFGGLSFGSSSAQAQPPAPSSSSALGGLSSPTSAAKTPASPPTTAARPAVSSSGGSFFDAKPKPATAAPTQSFSADLDDFGGFEGSTPSAPAPPKSSNTKKPAASAGNGLDDLFDFSEPAPAPPVAASKPAATESPFNLSAPKPQPTTVTPKAPPPISAANFMSDPWGSSDNAWASNTGPSTSTTSASAAAPSYSAQPPKATPTVAQSSPINEWGNDWATPAPAASSTATRPAPASKPAPQISADEDFGGWESSAAPAPVASSTTSSSRQNNTASASSAAPRPFVTNDAFDNPWE